MGSSPLLVILLFVLRIGVPLILTFAVAWLFDQLIARWESKQPDTAGNQFEQRCPLHARAESARVRWPTIPCWLAIELTEGSIPGECLGCPCFQESSANRSHLVKT